MKIIAQSIIPSHPLPYLHIAYGSATPIPPPRVTFSASLYLIYTVIMATLFIRKKIHGAVAWGLFFILGILLLFLSIYLLEPLS